jgi:hypothetical protein
MVTKSTPIPCAPGDVIAASIERHVRAVSEAKDDRFIEAAVTDLGWIALSFAGEILATLRAPPCQPGAADGE